MKPVSLKFDLTELDKGYQEVLQIRPFPKYVNRIALTYRPTATSVDEIYHGTSLRLEELSETHGRTVMEAEYCLFHEEYKKTYLYEVYRRIQEWSPYHLGRTRIMKLPPTSTYRVHKDAQIRYHIVLETNPLAVFLCADNCYGDMPAPNEAGLIEPMKVLHLPKDGRVWELDANSWHCALNGSDETDRVHLVICTAGRK